MKDKQNITIILLLVTAAILATMLVVTLNSPRAYAGSPVRGGDYIMVNGAFNENRDLVWVIDVMSKRMNVYELNLQRGAVDLIDGVELGKALGQ